MEPEKRKKIPPTRKNVVKIDNKGRAYISKKALGNKGNFNDIFKEWVYE